MQSAAPPESERVPLPRWVAGAPGARMEAVLQAAVGELPLSAICWYVVYDAERFRQATIVRYSATVRRRRGREDSN